MFVTSGTTFWKKREESFYLRGIKENTCLRFVGVFCPQFCLSITLYPSEPCVVSLLAVALKKVQDSLESTQDCGQAKTQAEEVFDSNRMWLDNRRAFQTEVS